MRREEGSALAGARYDFSVAGEARGESNYKGQQIR